MKRIISAILVFVMVLGMLPVNVWAAETAPDDGIERTVILLPMEEPVETTIPETTVPETTEAAQTTAAETEPTEAATEPPVTEAVTEPAEETQPLETEPEETEPVETLAPDIPGAADGNAEETENDGIVAEASYNGNYYQIWDRSMTWTQAKAFCEERDGHLLTITSAEEQAFIETMLISYGTKKQYWLGAYRNGNDYVWITDEVFAYSNWDFKEPNIKSDGAERESYAQLYNERNPSPNTPYSKRFKWNDIFEDNVYPGETNFFDTCYVGLICEFEGRIPGVSSTVETKPAEKTIKIKAKAADDPLFAKWRKDLEGFTVSSSLGRQTAEGGEYTIAHSEAVKKDIVISVPGFQDYVIPTAVLESFQISPLPGILGSSTNALWNVPVYTHTAYLQLDRQDEQPYISTTFGRRSTESTNFFLDLTTEDLKLSEGDLTDIIISAGGVDAKQKITYYIGNDKDHRLSSTTGVFSAVDLYHTIAYGEDVYAYATTEDGVSLEPVKLTITKEPDANETIIEYLQGSTFGLVGKDGMTVPIPKDYPLVGGGKINLKYFKLPVAYERQGNRLKFSFGVDFRKWENDTGTDGEWDKGDETRLWKNFKKSIGGLSKCLEKPAEAYKEYKALKKQYGVNKIPQKKEGTIQCEFLGYLEGDLINGKLIVKDFTLLVAGKFTFKNTKQFAILGVPAYFGIEAKANLGLSTQTVRFVADKEVPLEFGLLIDITPSLKGSLGAGIKGATSAGFWAKGTLPYSHNLEKKYHVLKLKGEAGLEAEFFVVEAEVTLFEGEKTVFEKYYGSKKSAALQAPSWAQTEPEITISVADRNYTPSSWLGDQHIITPHAVAASGVSFRDLQTDVFANSQPQIANFGDGLIMVWVEDDASRDAYNRMRLVYSLYDPAADSWSEAKPVADDGHNDAYPSLVSDGTSAYVVWQKIDKKLTAEDCTSLDALLENSEIYLSKFDGTFGPAQKLTDNSLYEYAAAVTLENGNPAVYYASARGQELNQAGKQTLFKNISGTETAVASGCNYILGIEASGKNVSYVMDGDGDTSTTNDINVYTVDGASFDKGENDVAYSWASYADFNGTKTLFTSDMQNIYYEENGEIKSVFPTDRSITGNLNIAQTSAGTAILWTETEEDWNELYAVSYEDGAWTEPVKISQQGERLSNVDIVSLNGRLVGVCNANYGYSTETNQKGKTDLSFFRVEDFTDIDVSSYLYFDETTLVPGQPQEFDVMLTNKGTTTPSELTFTITDTLGTSQTITKAVNLTPGSTDSVTLSYTVPSSYAGTTLTVNVGAPNDIDTTNNAVSIDIGKPDLSVTETAIHTFDDGYFIKATVENTSAVTASNVKLEVILADENNAPTFTQDLGTLGRSNYASVEIALEKDQLTFDENGAAKVYLRVSSENGEAADADNQICILITQPVAPSCGHAATETIPGYPASCTESGLTDGTKCTLCCEILEAQQTIPAAGHSYANGSCTRCGEADPNHTNPSNANVTRIAGKDRHETAFKIADMLKSELGIEKFSTMIIASGADSADALAGSYLAARRSAPILLSRGNSHARNLEYIQANLAPGGTVYILCGTAAVPEEMENLLKENNILYERLKGKTRFDTNLAILDKAGIEGDEILVSTGYNFADSLSASASGKPILLVHTNANVLTDSQEVWLETQRGKTFTIIGGTGAVSAELETALQAYGTTTRLKGSGREATSVEVAKKFFTNPDTALLAYSRNFPDGLCGGPLAYAMRSPLLLVNAGKEADANTYINQNSIQTGYILGGTGVISDDTARTVFSLGTDYDILKR